MFSIHLVRYTAQALDGSTEHGIARISTAHEVPSFIECLDAIPDLTAVEYLAPEPGYLLRYRTDDGVSERMCGASAIAIIGRALGHQADRGEAWGIEVLDERGSDVTFDFPIFCQ